MQYQFQNSSYQWLSFAKTCQLTNPRTMDFVLPYQAVFSEDLNYPECQIAAIDSPIIIETKRLFHD